MLDFYKQNEKEEKTKTGERLSFKVIRQTSGRIFRYSSVRILTILFTIGLGLYLTLLIVNLGG